MKLASIVGHILEVCALAEASSKPVDQIVWIFFKERHYLGARDRFRIRASVFGMQRDWRYVHFLSQSFFQNHSGEIVHPSNHFKYLPSYVAHARIVFEHPADDMLIGLEELWRTHYPSIDLASYIKLLEEHANDVLNIPDQVERLATHYSFPDWMVKRFLEQYGNETEVLLQGLNKSARATLRVNLLKVSREECQQQLLDETIESSPTHFSPVGLITTKRFNRQASPAFKQGLFEFQDEGSQLISLLADAKPGQFVIDACAGGGGKTMHMVEMMNDSGELIAIDIDAKRLEGLEVRKTRSHIRSIKLLTVDAINKNELTNKADLVLVDAPCSGVGRIRRSPDIKRHLTEAMVDSYPQKQKEILLSNADFVKQNGRLVYATCSLFKTENEDVVNTFLEERKDFRLVSPTEQLQQLGIEPSNDDFVRLLPHRYPTDGFFIAVMERNT
ncbi:MAG: class I SAM-dependent methyltransferase [Ignavibacteriae bacterium]|nr:class I SAM-dependent methyltransferase [Ignavibacteriota bacterium]